MVRAPSNFYERPPQIVKQITREQITGYFSLQKLKREKTESAKNERPGTPFRESQFLQI